MFKARLTGWGINKNSRDPQYQLCAILHHRRRLQGKMDSAFVLDGNRQVTSRDLRKYVKGRKLSDEQFLEIALSSTSVEQALKDPWVRAFTPEPVEQWVTVDTPSWPATTSDNVDVLEEFDFDRFLNNPASTRGTDGSLDYSPVAPKLASRLESVPGPLPGSSHVSMNHQRTPGALPTLTPPPRPVHIIQPSTRTCGSSDVLRSSLILSVVLTRRHHDRSLDLWLTGLCKGPATVPQRSDPDIMRCCVDLLSFLQLKPKIVTLAIIYLVRMQKVQNTDMALIHPDWDMWIKLIIAVKLALVYASDGWPAYRVWIDALKGMIKAQDFMVTEAWRVAVHLEREILASAFAFSVVEDEWQASCTLLDTVGSTSLQQVNAALSAMPQSPQSRVKDQDAKAECKWETHKAEIIRLYRTKKLEEVMSIMRTQHDFAASTRGYRTRLKEWNVRKRGFEEMQVDGEAECKDQQETVYKRWQPDSII